MPIFHCQVKAISRATGRSATAAAAYRSGERIIYERTGEVHDYRRKKGIIHKELVLPFGVRQLSRSELWNMAEAAENRKDAKVAREWEVALPAELAPMQRRDLAHDFARAVVKRYGIAVDVCIHAPNRKGDQRNYHVHFLTTTRVLERTGLKEKTRILDSPRTSGKEVTAIRELWERMCNQSLLLAGITDQIDHRSFVEQGIDKMPSRHLGPAASAMERRGVKTERGNEHVRTEVARLEKELADVRAVDSGIEAAKERYQNRKNDQQARRYLTRAANMENIKRRGR